MLDHENLQFSAPAVHASHEGSGKDMPKLIGCDIWNIPVTVDQLTLSQTTNFGLFQTDSVCRRQFKVL